MSRWMIEAPEDLTLDPVSVLRVRTIGGLVDVVGTDGPARLEVHAIEGAPLLVTHDEVSGELVVTYEDLTKKHLANWLQGARRTDFKAFMADGRALAQRHVEVSLAVPWDCTIEVGVVSAHATVSGMHGTTTVRSIGGDLTLVGLTGTVDANTVSGSVDAESMAGDLNVVTVAGSLTVIEGTGGKVRANSVSGPMILDLDAVGRSNVQLSTVSGELTVRLPHRGDMKVDVRSAGGSVDSAFDELTTSGRYGASHVSGRLGEGSGRLQINSISGDVALLRRAPEGKVIA
jgi:putative adhesin